MNINTLIHIYKLLKEEVQSAETEYKIASNVRRLTMRDLGGEEPIPEEIKSAHEKALARSTAANEALQDFESHEWK